MKTCPTCGNTYTDDSLVYCLQDGATLQSVSAGTNPLNLIATLPGDAEGYEETTSSKLSSAPTVEFSGAALQTAVNPEPRLTARSAGNAAPAAEQPPKTSRIVATTVVITLLILLLGGVGTWMLLRADRRARRAGAANDTNAQAAEATEAANTANDNQGRADKGGRWFVILDSFPKADLSRANQRLEVLRRQGFDAHLISSDDYPNLKDGLWVIVMGPYTRNNAEEVLGKVRPKVKDAYTKSGW